MTISSEEITKHYTNAGDSVTLINSLVAQSTRSTEDNETIARNVRHLEVMLAKDFWTSENLEPFRTAITAGKAALTS